MWDGGEVMDELTFVGFASARGFWRGVGRLVAAANPATEDVPPLLVRLLFQKGEGVDLGCMPAKTRVTSIPSRVATSCVEELAASHPELGETVDVCVSTQGARHYVRSCRVHLMTGSYPVGSFWRISASAVVVSPELAFLQSARDLDDDLLAAYGYELCGLYAREGEGRDGFVNCPALTSVARVAAYLDRLEELRRARGQGLPPGLAKARRALGRVRDRAASPGEAITSMVLTSPRVLGGFGLPPAKLNVCVRLRSSTAELFGIDSFVCDLSWDEGPVVEFQGGHHKLRSRAAYDRRKGNVLGADNRTVIQVDAAMLGRQDRMEEVAKSVGRGLGIRWREPSKTIRTRQMNLRKKLLVDLGR